MTIDPLGRLLDAAVPPIPTDLASPPYQRIRRLARRRQRHRALGVFAAVLLAAAPVALLQTTTGGLGTPVGGAETTALPAEPTPRPTAEQGTSGWPLTVRAARVHENDTSLTLYVNPDPEACIVSPLSIELESVPTQIQVKAAGAGVVDCDHIRVAEMSIDLALTPGTGPVGDRPLYDADGTPILTVYDADLPILPEPVRLLPQESSYLDGMTLSLVYDWSDGRTVVITVSRDEKPVDVVAEGVPLGRHTGVMIFTGHNYGVRWPARGLTYELLYFPAPTEGVSREGLLAFLATCQWR